MANLTAPIANPLEGIKLPDPDKVYSLIATQLVESAKGGTPKSEDLAATLAEIELETQTTGASFIKVEVIDPEWTILTSGLVDVVSEEGSGLPQRLQPLLMEYPEGSGYEWIFCAVETTTDPTESQVFTFEDRGVQKLREEYGPLLTRAGTKTRAQFAGQLLRSAGLKAVIPSENVLQPVSSSEEGELGEAIISTNIEAAEKERLANKAPAVNAGAQVTIKGQTPTTLQLHDLNTALSIADQLGAGEVATLALLIAGIAESNFERGATNEEPTQTDEGIWQSDQIPGAEVEKQAEAFLKGGTSFGAGGAIAKAKEGKSPGEIAKEVEVSQPEPSWYEAYLPEAKAILSAYGGVGTQTSTATAGSGTAETESDVGVLHRGTKENPSESSFECLTRLAQEVDWYFFTRNMTGYFMSGYDLVRQEPVAYINIPGNYLRTRHGVTEDGVLLIPSTGDFDNCVALDTRVPTPDGWTTMGELEVGGRVIGADGSPTAVIGVSAVHHGHDCYRVRFSDGTSVVADADHPWETIAVKSDGHTIERVAHQRYRGVRTTGEIAASLRTTSGLLNHRVRVAKPLDLPEAALPIDPYLLGYWLGDGSSSQAVITVSHEDMAHLVAEVERAGLGYSTKERVSTGFAAGNTHWTVIVHGIVGKLRTLGVLGAKRIPTCYQRASLEQRLALLQGLMDSDGCMTKHPCLSLADEALARDALELIRSLGFAPTWKEKAARGKSRRQRVIHFASRPHLNAFRLPRKAERYTQRVAGKSHPGRAYRTITAVEDVPSVPVRCIAVDAPDHLYLLGDGMVVGHNTTYYYQLAKHLKGRAPRKSKLATPESPSEIQLTILCEETAYQAGDVFAFEGSGPYNGRWVITDAVRLCMSQPYTTFTLQPPKAPLPEPKRTKAEEEEAGQLGLTVPASERKHSAAKLGETVEGLQKASSTPSKAGPVKGASVPQASWNPEKKPIAEWITPILAWAAAHGWKGVVVSGYRTNAEQEVAAAKYAAELGVPISEEYPDGPLASNHCGVQEYPKGAVDVTEAPQLNEVLKAYPKSPKLVWAEYTIEDGVHFSSDGH